MLPRTNWNAWLLAVPLALSALACRARDEPPGQIPGDTAAPQPLPPPGARLTDDNIVAFLSNANLTEINTARAARPRATSREVRDFAQRVIDEHSAMERALDSLVVAKGIPRQPPASQEVVVDAMAARADTLLRAPDSAFDSTYIVGQLAMDALFLDNLARLAAAATDEGLRILIRSWMPITQARVTKGVGLQRGI